MEGVQVAFVAAPLVPQILVHVLSKASRETGIVCEMVDGCVDCPQKYCELVVAGSVLQSEVRGSNAKPLRQPYRGCTVSGELIERTMGRC